MKIIIDECVNSKIIPFINSNSVTTVQIAGLANYENGKLLSQIQGNYDIFITLDKNIPHQQNLEKYSFTIIILKSKNNKLENLKTLIPKLNHAIKTQPQEKIIILEK